MPNEADHLAKYKENKRFVSVVKENKIFDWHITGNFYCALHLVERHIYKQKKLCCKTHFERNHLIESSMSFSLELKQAYKFLHDESRRFRYDCCTPSEEDVLLSNNSLKIVEKHLLIPAV